MGIRYGNDGINGSRLFDFEIHDGNCKTRLYSLLDYTQVTLFIFGETKLDLKLPDFIKVIQIYPRRSQKDYWVEKSPYANQAILVRPDSYIQSIVSLNNVESLLYQMW